MFVLLRKVWPRGKFNFLEFWLCLPCVCRIFKTVGWNSEACKFAAHEIMCLNLHVKVGRKSVVIKTRLRRAGATHSNVAKRRPYVRRPPGLVTPGVKMNARRRVRSYDQLLCNRPLKTSRANTAKLINAKTVIMVMLVIVIHGLSLSKCNVLRGFQVPSPFSCRLVSLCVEPCAYYPFITYFLMWAWSQELYSARALIQLLGYLPS